MDSEIPSAKRATEAERLVGSPSSARSLAIPRYCQHTLVKASECHRQQHHISASPRTVKTSSAHNGPARPI